MKWGCWFVLSCMVALAGAACKPKACQLPNCRCYNDPSTPGGLEIDDTPQIIMVSFEGTLNQQSYVYYRSIFDEVVNPNGCPARGTFFIEDQGTDYAIVKSLYDQGHEIGIQSVDGNAPSSSTAWIDQLKKVKSQLTDIGLSDKAIKGVRAPQLAIGGSEELIGLGTNQMLYDSSCTNQEYSNSSRLLWPYTFDSIPSLKCDTGRTPDLAFNGKWEVIVADLHDLEGDNLPCVVPSACRNITTKRNAFDLFFTEFMLRLNGSRTPFNMIIDPTWAANDELRAGTVQFLQYARASFGDNVWVVPIADSLAWIQNPTPIANLTTFEPWSC